MYTSEETMMFDKLRKANISKELLSFSWLTIVFATILIVGQFWLGMSVLAELGAANLPVTITTIIDVLLALIIAHIASFWVRIYFRHNIN